MASLVFGRSVRPMRFGNETDCTAFDRYGHQHMMGAARPWRDQLSLKVRILRDNANASGLFDGADGYAGVVGVLSFDVHIQLNSIGSDEQYQK